MVEPEEVGLGLGHVENLVNKLGYALRNEKVYELGLQIVSTWSSPNKKHEMVH